ncbi:MAG: hypothetical protein E7486_04900 [Ruminococcaceae bacterium]|nr:hypothetical protein [Oscillospiraceae bacterium]
MVFTVDPEGFALARTRAEQAPGGGIGTLKEKLLHRTLKYYFSPSEDCHELALGGYVADILGENGVIEIQTGSYARLQEKLQAFLPLVPVTVVCPLIAQKELCRVSPEGELLPGRRSPKHQTPFHIFEHLRGIREFLGDENLRVCICMIEGRELRYPQRVRAGRKRVEQKELIPDRLTAITVLHRPADYLALLPPELCDPFSVTELARAADVPRELASLAVYVLKQAGFLLAAEKKGNAILYRRAVEKL